MFWSKKHPLNSRVKRGTFTLKLRLRFLQQPLIRIVVLESRIWVLNQANVSWFKNWCFKIRSIFLNQGYFTTWLKNYSLKMSNSFLQWYSMSSCSKTPKSSIPRLILSNLPAGMTSSHRNLSFCRFAVVKLLDSSNNSDV